MTDIRSSPRTWTIWILSPFHPSPLLCMHKVLTEWMLLLNLSKCVYVKAFVCERLCICVREFVCVRKFSYLRSSHLASSHRHHICALHISDPHISDFHILHLHIRRSSRLRSSYIFYLHICITCAHLRIWDPHTSDRHIIYPRICVTSAHLHISDLCLRSLHLHFHVFIFTFIFRFSYFDTTSCLHIFGFSSRSHTVLSYHPHDFIIAFFTTWYIYVFKTSSPRSGAKRRLVLKAFVFLSYERSNKRVGSSVGFSISSFFLQRGHASWFFRIAVVMSPDNHGSCAIKLSFSDMYCSVDFQSQVIFICFEKMGYEITLADFVRVKANVARTLTALSFGIIGENPTAILAGGFYCGFPVAMAMFLAGPFHCTDFGLIVFVFRDQRPGLKLLAHNKIVQTPPRQKCKTWDPVRG